MQPLVFTCKANTKCLYARTNLLPSLCTMTAMATTAIILFLESVLLSATFTMLILCIATSYPCNRIIIERAVLFTAIPAPASSTAGLLMKAVCIESTRKNIRAGIIL